MKKIPFTKEQIEKLKEKYPTPFHIYDEKAIVDNFRDFKDAFSWVDNFKEYYAVKACPNPSILKILKEEGSGADCSSMAELILAEQVGMKGEEIMFTSNDTPEEEFQKAFELDAIINFDDISHIPFFMDVVGKAPNVACCRYNPGPLREGNAIIGNPEEAKYGMTRNQIIDAYAKLKELGVKKIGLHTMVASNELDPNYFVETARMLFELVEEIEEKTGIVISFVNLGGGIGIPYRPEDKKVDFHLISKEMEKVYNQYFSDRKDKLNIVVEMGRMITGPYGYLVSEVRHIKNIYKKYIGLDACMSDLMRPALYGAYHHITVLGKENVDEKEKVDVTGSLCENNDKFAIDRLLPKNIESGDLIVIHDAGAHGHAMGFNYNGKLRHAEFLLKENGEFEMIRRAETLDDYFATLKF